MKDRVSQYPGRLRLVSQSGQYYTFERADNPLQEGTPINKAALLRDETAQLYGLGGNAVPDDVFYSIANGRAKIATGSYTGANKYGENQKNSITFPFTPKLVIITREGVSQSSSWGQPMLIPYFWGETKFYTGAINDYCQQLVSLNGNTMSWYSNGGNSGYQLDQSNKTYNWVAIGI